MLPPPKALPHSLGVIAAHGVSLNEAVEQKRQSVQLPRASRSCLLLPLAPSCSLQLLSLALQVGTTLGYGRMGKLSNPEIAFRGEAGIKRVYAEANAHRPT